MQCQYIFKKYNNVNLKICILPDIHIYVKLNLSDVFCLGVEKRCYIFSKGSTAPLLHWIPTVQNRKAGIQYGSCFSDIIIPFIHFFSSLFSLPTVKILLSGGHSSPDMALWFIDIQNLPGLGSQFGVYLNQTICDIFMYRTLADSKFFRCLPYRGIRLNDITCNLYRPLLNIIFQREITPQTLFLQCMRKSQKDYRNFRKENSDGKITCYL